jgi:hypothetical protein
MARAGAASPGLDGVPRDCAHAGSARAARPGAEALAIGAKTGVAPQTFDAFIGCGRMTEASARAASTRAASAR